MKKLILISLLILIVMFPSTIFALDVYSTPVHADFVNLSNKLNPSGTADIVYDNTTHAWTVTLKITGLLRNHSDYLFQFAIADQIVIRYDYDLNKTDGKGNLNQTFSITDLNKITDYTVVRIIDRCGQSGGVRIRQADPNAPPDLPYLKRGTVVIRAREDDETLFKVP